ncbi:MAG: response regulator [Butyrivibrio sp.]
MRIIAVDDEKIALEGLVDSIKDVVKDCEVMGFRECTEALEYVRQNGCDIAFLDIRMRDMSGITLAKKLKEIKSQINIIFTTGYGEYAEDAFKLHASGYVLKPVTPEGIKTEMENLRHPLPVENTRKIRVRAFGNFEVFYDNKPIKFRYNKTRELLAYLVDRQGALCSNREIMSVLWENDEDDATHNSYLKKIRVDLTDVFDSLNCEDVLIRQWGKIGIVPDRIDCDYFDYLAGKPYAINAYRGEYMTQYSWSELTHGVLEE